MAIRGPVDVWSSFVKKAGEGPILVTYGAAQAAGDHVESTTADASKGSWLQGASEWNEATNALGIDCTDPQYNLDLGATAKMRFQALANGILAVDANGVVYVTPQGLCPPSAPTNLALSAITSSAITLSWTVTSNNESGLKVERSTDNFATSTLVTTTAATVSAYTDTGLSASTLYYYRVKATNAGGDSAPTNVASATTAAVSGAPAAPSNLTLSGVTSSSITLNWTDNSTNETGFKVERSRDNFATNISITTTAANATTYTDTTPNPSTLYYYRVRATNASGDSANSNIASATTNAGATVSDNFTRANSTTSLGTANPTGQAWTAYNGVWGISSNAGYLVSHTGTANQFFDLATVAGQSANGVIQCKIAALQDACGIMWRGDSLTTLSTGNQFFYRCHYWQGQNKWHVGYWYQNAWVDATNQAAVVPAAGDILRVKLQTASPQMTVDCSHDSGATWINVWTSSVTDDGASGFCSHFTGSALHGLKAEATGTFRVSSFSFS